MKPMNQRGQAQLLGAAAMASIMLTGALYALTQAQQDTEDAVRLSRRSEMRAALDGASRMLQEHFISSVCDPVAFNAKLNRIQPDGTLAPVGAVTSRVLNVPILGRTYTVSIGPIYMDEWTGGVNPSDNLATIGTSQDSSLELWTSDLGFRNQVLLQRVTYINNCTYPCAVAAPAGESGYCPVASHEEVSYHQFFNGLEYLMGALPANCQGNLMGDMDGDGFVNVKDLTLFRNHIRSGDRTGFETPLLIDDGFPTTYECIDFNRDRLINEVDLGILEKILRGYLYRIPTRYRVAPSNY